MFYLNIQLGGELMDFIIVLHGLEAVKTFSSRMHFSLGAGLSAAAGPVGRVLEADVRAGNKGSGVCYTYSHSKGNVLVQFKILGSFYHVKSSSVCIAFLFLSKHKSLAFRWHSGRRGLLKFYILEIRKATSI